MSKQKVLPIDIVDQYNQPIIVNSTIDEANNHGLWHRGALVIMYRPNGSILIQRRSNNTMLSPGKLSPGAGGAVDQGETPEQAAIREVKEETGITLKPEDLSFLGLFRLEHNWRFLSRRKIGRSFDYVFLAQINNDIKPVLQREEVGSIKFISLEEAKKLLQPANKTWRKSFAPPLRIRRKILKAAVREIDWRLRQQHR